MSNDNVTPEEVLEHAFSELDHDTLIGAFGADNTLGFIRGLIKKFHEEYMASIKIGLTTKNYAERKKAFENALAVMKENGIEVLQHQFNRKPSDIVYSLDYRLRVHYKLSKDFRRSAIWFVAGKESKLPRVSKHKDEEVALQEEGQSKTKSEIDDRDRYKEDYFLNNIESLI